MAGYTAALAAQLSRRHKHLGVGVLLRSRILDAVLGALFTLYTAIFCSLLLVSPCALFVWFHLDHSKRNMSVRGKDGSRTARVVLQTRAQYAAFGFGPD